jgi:RNA polymerase sigma-70 factor, ECF subfamily
VSDERELLLRAAGGDEAAAGEIYDRYAPALMKFLVVLLGKEQAAEDALQETFALLFRDAAKYDPRRAGLGTWLRRLAFGMARNELRRRQRKPALSLETVVRSEDGHMRPLLELLAGRDQGEARQAADLALKVLNRLTEEDRQVLVLRYIEGLPPRDIAVILHATPKAISMRIWRAISALQKELGQGAVDSW